VDYVRRDYVSRDYVSRDYVSRDYVSRDYVSTNRVCSCPWQLFALVKADPLLCVTRNCFIPDQIYLGQSAVVFCVCKVIQLFSVVFFVVSGVHKFDLWEGWGHYKPNT
jgi:hypothetical protein